MKMTKLRGAILVAIGLIMALAWAAMPPTMAPPTGLPLAEQKLGQCPAGTTLEGKLCVCPRGTDWSGTACVAR
ncbi:hypothetical protein KY495_03830 [Massilia sp. PAMC28688]|uniref:hypothetical protein n=1 Tax=Massilia sp. PAMC28688 TaxID=2861283 RepID=UPI001C630ABE|nr:hypothetical protein [Massilia sp. PAMC28688]QYF94359.1 hypothetical protein KY495_03830 [Massilia sp. PAMC28688]